MLVKISQEVARSISVLLRVSTIAGKSSLLFFAAKGLDPIDVGLYGLLVASVGYGIYLIGFDFYTFSTREIIKGDRKSVGALLKTQIAMHAALYAIVLPAYYFVFAFGLIPLRFVWFFYGLIALEHVNQEMYRVLIALGSPLKASFALFIRHGLWAILVVTWAFASDQRLSLDLIMTAWVAGSASSSLISFFWLWSENLGGWAQGVDLNWIRKGMIIAVPFLVSTLALRGIFTFDRFLVEEIVGSSKLAPYVLFIGVTNILMALLNSGVVTFAYPRLIALVGDSNWDQYLDEMLGFARQVALACIAFAVGAVLFIKPVLAWIGKSIYVESLPVFYTLLAAFLVYGLSLVPHFGLYALRKDLTIVYSQVLGFTLFVFLALSLPRSLHEVLIPTSLFVAFSFIFFFKALVFISAIRGREKNSR